MKAAVYRSYGSPGVVTVDDVPKPVPGDEEVLVRVQDMSLCRGSAGARRAGSGAHTAGIVRPVDPQAWLAATMVEQSMLPYVPMGRK